MWVHTQQQEMQSTGKLGLKVVAPCLFNTHNNLFTDTRNVRYCHAIENTYRVNTQNLPLLSTFINKITIHVSDKM